MQCYGLNSDDKTRYFFPFPHKQMKLQEIEEELEPDNKLWWHVRLVVVIYFLILFCGETL